MLTNAQFGLRRFQSLLRQRFLADIILSLLLVATGLGLAGFHGGLADAAEELIWLSGVAFIAPVMSAAAGRPFRRGAYSAITISLFFTGAVAFLLPPDSPFIALSVLILLVDRIALGRRAVILVSGLLVIALELALLRTTAEHVFTPLNGMIVHLLYISITAVALQWTEPPKSAKARQLANADEVESVQLRQLVNSMADGVVAINDRGYVTLYNGAALEILDLNVSMENQRLNKFLHVVDEKGKPIDLIAQVNQHNGHFTSRDLLLKYSENEHINLYLNISAVRLGYGKVGNRGFILILRDITKEKSLEEERDEFISVVSHELRTPVAIAEGNISNALFLLGKGASKDSLNKMLAQTHDQVLFLAGLINDLSTLARAERGTLQLDPQPVDPKQLAELLVSMYANDAAQKGLSLVTEISDNVRPFVTSELYLREVLQNFITNAIKYSQTGTIRLQVEPWENGAAFSVVDTGIGISKSDQKRVFEKFFRSEDYRTRQSSGTGLGLYVTTKLAQIIKGRIELSSELNKGSTFTISVPALPSRSVKRTASAG